MHKRNRDLSDSNEHDSNKKLSTNNLPSEIEPFCLKQTPTHDSVLNNEYDPFHMGKHRHLSCSRLHDTSETISTSDSLNVNDVDDVTDMLNDYYISSSARTKRVIERTSKSDKKKIQCFRGFRVIVMSITGISYFDKIYDIAPNERKILKDTLKCLGILDRHNFCIVSLDNKQVVDYFKQLFYSRCDMIEMTEKLDNDILSTFVERSSFERLNVTIQSRNISGVKTIKYVLLGSLANKRINKI